MYAVIGAGPMGLATARNLDKYGIDFVGFERHADVGGLWDIDNPHSTVYESAHLISSKSMTEFVEFPMPEETPNYPDHRTLKQYFRDYARHFDLYRRYEFDTRVIAVEPHDDGWRIVTEHAGRHETRVFDGVLIASGILHEPNRPTLPGAFDGALLHAGDYRDPSLFTGKRVLIVGCGNSACDIAVDAVHHAASVDLSVRRGYHFLPKFIGGKPTDTLGGKFRLPRRLKQWLDARLIEWVVGKPSDYGLPDPDYRLYESHPVINSLVLHHLGHGDITPRNKIADMQGHTVTFADGAQTDCDLVLLATGYKLHYPFIDAAHLNWHDGDAPSLYLNVFHPEHNDLFLMGMIEATGLGWEGRNLQAQMVALYIHQLTADQPAARKLERIKKEQARDRIDGGYAYLPLARMAYYVHKDSYLKKVRAHIRELETGLSG